MQVCEKVEGKTLLVRGLTLIRIQVVYGSKISISGVRYERRSVEGGRISGRRREGSCMLVTTQAPRVRHGTRKCSFRDCTGGQFRRFRAGRRKRNRYRQVELRIGAAGLGSKQGQAPQQKIYSSTKAIWAKILDDIFVSDSVSEIRRERGC